jgi:hypothetical protein
VTCSPRSSSLVGQGHTNHSTPNEVDLVDLFHEALESKYYSPGCIGPSGIAESAKETTTMMMSAYQASVNIGQ